MIKIDRQKERDAVYQKRQGTQKGKIIKMPESKWLKEFGARLRHARTLSNYTSTEDFARQLSIHVGEHISPQTIANYERGDRQPPLEMVSAISDFLPNLPLDYWFHGASQKAGVPSAGAAIRRRRRSRPE